MQCIRASLDCLEQIPNDQTFCFLFQSLGIEEEDFPKLSQFLIKHKEQTEVRKE